MTILQEAVFIEAIKKGNEKEVISLLNKQKTLVHRIDQNNRTALHEAVQQNFPSIVRLLINRGAKINAQDKNGQTPLHCVQDPSIAKALIEEGANINVQDTLGNTP